MARRADDPDNAGGALEQPLIEHCRQHLAHYKCPRTVDFVEELPRTATGKLLKRELRDRNATSDVGAAR